MRMRKIFLAALAVAAVLGGGMLGGGWAAAMVPAASSGRGLAGDAGLVRRVLNVCGTNGCVKVQTQRVVKRHPPAPPPMPHH
jgi:hypothetical protein